MTGGAASLGDDPQMTGKGNPWESADDADVRETTRYNERIVKLPDGSFIGVICEICG
jgi:hypothetical protein